MLASRVNVSAFGIAGVLARLIALAFPFLNRSGSYSTKPAAASCLLVMDGFLLVFNFGMIC